MEKLAKRATRAFAGSTGEPPVELVVHNRKYRPEEAGSTATTADVTLACEGGATSWNPVDPPDRLYRLVIAGTTGSRDG